MASYLLGSPLSGNAVGPDWEPISFEFQAGREPPGCCPGKRPFRVSASKHAGALGPTGITRLSVFIDLYVREGFSKLNFYHLIYFTVVERI